MTLEELMETNGHIARADVTVRGTKESEYQRVSEWRIGARADYYRCDRAEDKTLHIIQKPIHCRDDGAESYQYGQIMKNVPKELRQLEVTSWDLSYEHPAPQGCHDFKHLRCDVRSDEYVRLLERQTRAKQAQAKDEEDQIMMEGM